MDPAGRELKWKGDISPEPTSGEKGDIEAEFRAAQLPRPLGGTRMICRKAQGLSNEGHL